MTEHQIHVLTRIFLAFVFIVGMIALFAFLSSRRAKAVSAKAKKKDEGEFYNFDEVRRRELNRNRRRGKAGKNIRRR